MHIFITGVAGFLGSNLADFYLTKGHKVSGCDNLVGGDFDNVHPDIVFYKGNCENLDFMKQATNKNIDVLCHAAAYAHEGLSSVSPTIICNNNVTGSTAVFTAAIINKIKRIVYCSSMARYGNIEIPYKEDSVLNPVDPYGVSKVAAEKILKILCDTHDVEYNIAVPHNIIYGDGEQTRCFSDIVDCIYCLDQLITKKHIISETVNIGPDEESISMNELFKKIANKLQFNREPEYFLDRPNEIKHATCSSDKARKILNYNTTVALDDSIDKVINFIKKNGTKKFQYNYALEIQNEKTPKTWKEKIF